MQNLWRFGFTMKAKPSKVRCDCAGSEPGKIDINIKAHSSECWIRKKILSKRFTNDTSVIPTIWNDGVRLGVVK
jgi:hypothetical protein